MPEIPTLDPASARILRLVKDQGVVRGKEILKKRPTQVSAQEVVEAVQKLVSSELITIKGDAYDAEGLAQAYLVFRPSTTDIAEFAIKSAH